MTEVARALLLPAQAISYAFDRDRLVREHPYGYLSAVRKSFDVASQSGHPLPAITDPGEFIRSRFRRMWGVMIDSELRVRLGVPPRPNPPFLSASQ
jgi:hypothetical protein